jgi:cell division protease FtsH
VNSTVKTVVFWLVILLSALLLWQVVKTGQSGQKDKEINFSELLTAVDDGNVKDVTINGQEVKGKYKNDNSGFHTTAPANYPGHDQDDARQRRGINIRDMNSGSWPLQLWGTWASLIFAGCALVLHDPPDATTGGNKALSFGKSRARLLLHAAESHVQRRGRRG